MLATYRVPLLDARRFVSDTAVFKAVKLPVPWDGRSFIRGMGKIESRATPAADPWSYESTFANLKRTLTFPPSAVQALNRQTEHNHVHSIRKRAWRGLDRSTALLDVDFGMQINPFGSHGITYPRKTQFDLGELVNLVATGAALPVRLRSREHTLYTLGKPLAEHYAHQTSEDRAGDGLVRAGFITAVVEAPGLTGNIPEWMRTERVTGSHIQLASHDTEVSGGGRLRVHVLWGDRGTTGDRALIRQLRIHIMRLHSIYELLRFLASPAALHANLPFSETPDEKSFDHLQRTLYECMRIVERPDAIGGAPLSAVLNAAFFSRQFANRDLPSMLGQTLDNMRPKVVKKVKRFIKNEDRRLVDDLAAEEERNRFNLTQIIFEKGASMGDIYKIKNNNGPVGPNSKIIGPVGKNAKVVGTVTGDDSQVSGNISAKKVTIDEKPFKRAELLDELVKLRDHLRESNDQEAQQAGQELVLIENHLHNEDAKGFVGALQKAGKYAMNAAGQIGMGLAQTAISAAMGLS